MRERHFWLYVLAARWTLSSVCGINVVRDIIHTSSNVTCSGTGPSCFCHQHGLEPRPRITLEVTLSLPAAENAASSAPLLVFFHGYGGRIALVTGDYQPYALAATAAGFGLLEYDVVSGGGLMSVVADTIELDFLPAILSWAKNLTIGPGRKLDLDRVAVAGHSRGGKLAAIHYARSPSIFAAYLIDPIDCPCFAPCKSDCYPSALRAITTAGRPLAVSGADVKGCCNPRGGATCSYACQAACYAASGNTTCTGNDFQAFLDVAGGGSRGFTQDAGHMQFAAIRSTSLRALANVLCGSSLRKSSEDVSSAAARHMMDWLEHQLPKTIPDSIAESSSAAVKHSALRRSA